MSDTGQFTAPGLGGKKGGGQTLGHAQIRPHHQHELALLLDLLWLLSRLGGTGGFGGSSSSAQPLAPVGVLAIGPVGRVVEDGVVLVNVRLLALDRVLPVVLALGLEIGRDEVAADRVDAEEEARDEGDDRGRDDDGGGDGPLEGGCGGVRHRVVWGGVMAVEMSWGGDVCFVVVVLRARYGWDREIIWE